MADIVMRDTNGRFVKGYPTYPRTQEICQKISEAKKGHNVSSGTRKKISQTLESYNTLEVREERSRKLKEYYETHDSPTKGRKLTSAQKKKISIAMSGENSPNWRGGISAYPYSFEFLKLREQIRTRDGFSCQRCGISENGRKHSVHHIDGNKMNSSFENLITLCISCHQKIERTIDSFRNKQIGGIRNDRLFDFDRRIPRYS